KEFGAAGREVVIEERLDGPEVSVMALVDGRSIYVLETSQDHKRLLDGDKGPNTGGMGAVCPSPRVDDALMARVEREVLVPTVDALRREGIEYRGVLYAGLMLTHGGPKVLEFNCRFGDPECQAIVSRLESDVIDLMEATCRGTLDSCEIAWRSGASCCVVVAAPGYPNEPRAGLPIAGLDRAGAVPGVTVYHAGTARDREGRVVTAGGRVLGVTGVGSSAAEARARAYEACGLIQFEGMQYRRDIG
ncbi:MAG: phosphoribosylamine--glycine ligase, partial [Candidatus Hydrogenedentes bacterium]|nr:phosphoribosylamine--glycine ligase [Candidatus Hydrogenedentota bacterium]